MTVATSSRSKIPHQGLGIWPRFVGLALCSCLILVVILQLNDTQNFHELFTQLELKQTMGALGELLQLERLRALAQRQNWLNAAMGLMVGVSLFGFFSLLKRVKQLRLEDELVFLHASEEQARLEALLTERSDSLAKLATHLQNVREEERGFLARELHDELGALLTAAKFDVARVKAKLEAQQIDLAMERLSHLTQTLNSGIALKRRMVEDLRPSSLDNLGLVAALEILAREFSEGAKLPVHTQLEEVKLSTDSALTVYRLVQESLTNIAKHAQAKKVDIELSQTQGGVKVVVTDDGVGFPASSINPKSHGLAGMHHRVTSAGGQLRISRGGPEGGTRVEAYLPF